MKPGNILLSPTGAKLLDFGVAKQTSIHSSDAHDLTLTEVTSPGLFLGTPRYASPEQFRGDPVDARSDLFSTGALLFEMLTGQSPFPGKSFGEIAHSVLHVSPPALTGSPAISALGRILRVAMARDPNGRYPTAEAMAADVRAALLMDGIETQARARPLRRLIVLPFRLLRPSEEIQFLAFSLPEAITVSRGGLDNLTVRSSIVAAQYSADSPDLQKIAREAEVDLVLTGALLQLGERLRITSQLVEVRSGTLLWSHSSQATIRELLELHDDLVRRVLDSILPSLTDREQQSLQQERPARATVYELYLRANEYGRHWETCRRRLRSTNNASPLILLTRLLGPGSAAPAGFGISTTSVPAKVFVPPMTTFNRPSGSTPTSPLRTISTPSSRSIRAVRWMP